MMNRGSPADYRPQAVFCGEQCQQQLAIELARGGFDWQQKCLLKVCRHDR
jgi:hypothetical protein